MSRPHCQQPSACQAKGAGHCRSCNFKAVAKRLHADPEFKAADAERAAERMKRLNADPEFKAARIRKLGLLPQEADEYRAIRRKGFSPVEAAGIVIASRRKAFA